MSTSVSTSRDPGRPIPILFLGDSPSLRTGLARIGRDLATQLARLPQYRVAFLGRGNGAHIGGGIADARLPFKQYTYQPTPDNQWGARELPDVWHNWAQGERGVVFTVWDPSRLTWFGAPRLGTDGDGQYSELQRVLTSGQFAKWGYFAIDAEGPMTNGGLVPMLADTLRGYDRLIAYTEFGKRVIEAWIADDGRRVDCLPHGFNGSVFVPRDRWEAGARFGLDLTHSTMIGCVMANQPRKDWGVWAESMRLVIDRLRAMDDRRATMLWAHTDSVDRYWDLRMLVDAFGLAKHMILTTDTPSDTEMSWRYSACDVTVLPSLGEGWGYPLVESAACGVPTVHVNYAGGAELATNRVPIEHYRYDGRWVMARPVIDSAKMARQVVNTLDSKPQSVAQYDWRTLWPTVWEPWFVTAADEFNANGGAR